MRKQPSDTKWPKFTLPKRQQPIYSFAKRIALNPMFKCRLESEIKELPDKAIILSIHAAKHGPIAVSVSYPKLHMIWGHHSMLGSYIDRFRYLRNVLYIQKLHKGKFIATLKAVYEAFFAKFFYKAMRVIGTYTDIRFLETVKSSMKVLDDNRSIIIFPEDSSKGYFDEITSALPGFIMLSETYYSRRGEDVPIIPMYISRQKRRVIVGKPHYGRELTLKGYTRDKIAALMKDEINSLYRSYIATDKPVGEPTVSSAPVRSRDYYSE